MPSRLRTSSGQRRKWAPWWGWQRKSWWNFVNMGEFFFPSGMLCFWSRFRYSDLLDEYGVRLNVIGRKELLPATVQNAVEKAENMTRHNERCGIFVRIILFGDLNVHKLGLSWTYACRTPRGTRSPLPSNHVFGQLKVYRISSYSTSCIWITPQVIVACQANFGTRHRFPSYDFPCWESATWYTRSHKWCQTTKWFYVVAGKLDESWFGFLSFTTITMQCCEHTQIQFSTTYWPNFGLFDFIPVILDYQRKIWSTAILP